MKKVELSEGLIDELYDIKKSMTSWTSMPVSMDTVVKTIIQYYYLSIGYPPSQWSRPLKGDTDDILEMKFMEGRKVRDIALRLALSEADLYRKQKVAIESVARIILEMEEQVKEADKSKEGFAPSNFIG